MIVSPAAAPDGLHELERLPQHLLLGLGGVESVVVSALFGRRCKGRKNCSHRRASRYDGTGRLHYIALHECALRRCTGVARR